MGAKVVTKEEAEKLHEEVERQGPVDPEVKAKRREELEAEAEKFDAYSFERPDVDRELAHQLITLRAMEEVQNAEDGYQYKWEYSGEHGRHITAAKLMGWEVVQGDMKEAEQHKCVDSTRRLGDCILMRITNERYLELRRAQAMRRQKEYDSSYSGPEQLAEKHAKHGVKISRLENSPYFDVAVKRAIAKHFAGRRFDKMLREGSVPGMDIRGQ